MCCTRSVGSGWCPLSPAGLSCSGVTAARRHPTVLRMVLEALQAGEKRRGTSVAAIKLYILHKYPTVDISRFKYLLKQALATGMRRGLLARPLNSKARGATGSFKVSLGEGSATWFSPGPLLGSCQGIWLRPPVPASFGPGNIHARLALGPGALAAVGCSLGSRCCARGEGCPLPEPLPIPGHGVPSRTLWFLSESSGCWLHEGSWSWWAMGVERT